MHVFPFSSVKALVDIFSMYNLVFLLIAEFEENNLLDRYEIVSRVVNESGKLVLSLILVPLVYHFNNAQFCN